MVTNEPKNEFQETIKKYLRDRTGRGTGYWWSAGGWGRAGKDTE